MKNITRVSAKSAFYFVFMSVIIAFAACNKNNAQTTNSKTGSSKNSASDKPMIEFRRTPCYGTCPIYRATISRDGKMFYEGINFVDKTGQFTATVSDAEIKDLLARAKQIDFWQYDSLYVIGATDFPSAVITLRDGGKSKTIRTEGEEPLPLKEFINIVDEVIKNALRENAVPVK